MLYQPHVVSATGIMRYKPCIFCGYLVDTDTGFAPIIKNEFVKDEWITTNGSYILDNGIIVLVDADVETYFNGSLIFYRKEEEFSI